MASCDRSKKEAAGRVGRDGQFCTTAAHRTMCNANQVESLQEQIGDSIREQLGTKRILDSKPSKTASSTGKKAHHGSDSDDDDDDDFYDRTKSKRRWKRESYISGRTVPTICPPPRRSPMS